ncbi:hypothetical protein BDQ17DRAFT_1249070, partial [Cyathus striatus]
LRITSDEITMASLSNTLSSSLSSPLSTCSSANISLTEPIPLNSSTEDHPKPEEAIQYYRASSIVLSLDGFNNSIAHSKNISTFLYMNVPEDAVDGNVVSCVNRTVGENVLLPNGGWGVPEWWDVSDGCRVGLVFLFFVVLFFDIVGHDYSIPLIYNSLPA